LEALRCIALQSRTNRDISELLRASTDLANESTFLGWRAFHSACHACHGVDAVGTDVAPNLVERLKGLSAHDFSVKVLTSYRPFHQARSAVMIARRCAANLSSIGLLDNQVCGATPNGFDKSTFGLQPHARGPHPPRRRELLYPPHHMDQAQL
jgi:hypothetical protein